MEELILGFDLCDDVTKISQYRSDNMNPADIGFPQAEGRTMIQTALGRRKGSDTWLVGKEAYQLALEGSGSVVDHLVTLLGSEESVVVGEKRFRPEELLQTFIGTLLETVYENAGCRDVGKLVFTLEKTDPSVMDRITHCMDGLGIGRDRISIISHTEAYLYYILSQPKVMYDSRAVLFDWSGSSLYCYELNLTRGVNPNVVRTSRQLLETSLSPDGLDQDTHRKMVDATIRHHVETLVGHKSVSAFFVSGKPMENCKEWGTSFLSAALNAGRAKKVVYYESNIFSKGAAIVANNELRGKSPYPYTIICEGRVPVTIWIDTVCKGSRKELVLVREGTNWYECRSTTDLLLDDINYIRLKIRRTGEKLTLFENISLEAFPKRPNKTTRVRLILSFTSEHVAMVRVQDLGFGEFFPSSGIVVKKELRID